MMASTLWTTLRKDCKVSLIGYFSSQIIGSKLPSKRKFKILLSRGNASRPLDVQKYLFIEDLSI